jgi:hypothetical protein
VGTALELPYIQTFRSIVLLEQAQAALAEVDVWSACASQKTWLEVVVEARGAWEHRDLLVLNPEGKELETRMTKLRF